MEKEIYEQYDAGGILFCADTEKIARVSKCGEITWYKNRYVLSEDDVIRVAAAAGRKRLIFEKELAEMSPFDRFGMLISMAPDSVFHQVLSMGEATMEQKISYMKGAIMERRAA